MSPIPETGRSWHKWRAHALQFKARSYSCNRKERRERRERETEEGEGEKERRRRLQGGEGEGKISPVAAPASLSGLLVHVQGSLICLLKYQTSVLLLLTYPYFWNYFSPRNIPCVYLYLKKKKKNTLLNLLFLLNNVSQRFFL